MIAIVNTFLKMSIISNLTFYIYCKVTNMKQIESRRVISNGMLYLVVALIYAWTGIYMRSLTLTIGCILIFGITTHFVIRNNKRNFWLAYITSFCISYIIYLVSVCIVGVFIYVVSDIEISSLICPILIACCSLTMAALIFKMKRLSKGINFINEFRGNKDIILSIVVMLFCLLLARDLFQKADDRIQIIRIVTSSIIVGSFVVFYIISQLITKHYKNNMRDRTINIQKEEIDANVKVIEELKEQNLKLSTTIHKYNHRLSALENSIRKVMDRSNAEFASELSIVLEQTKRVEAQFAEETKAQVELPSTNVIAIDNMLEYMRNEAFKSNIDFTLKLSDSIIPLLDKHISEDKFETLLADHIKDAIIAIKSKSEGYKSILVLIGIVDGAYELSIYDTGVEFDIPTLLKLGTEPVTTHKDNGGSGLGFMTTFETLKCSRASLVIEEYDSNVTNYTKSVTIRFDGKCEYRIYSYRADDIKKDCGNRSRIKIKKI